MRNVHHMNASGTCLFRQLGLSREERNCQFARAGGVVISTVEVGDEGLRMPSHSPGSPLLQYLITGDVPRSSLSPISVQYWTGPQCSNIQAFAQIGIASHRVFRIHTFVLFKQRSRRHAPLRCSENQQWSALALFYPTSQTRRLVTLLNLAYTVPLIPNA